MHSNAGVLEREIKLAKFQYILELSFALAELDLSISFIQNLNQER